jgi:hypothetical protein
MSVADIQSVLLDREGIQSGRYPAESKDIFKNEDKVTLKFDPQKVWLLMDIRGRHSLEDVAQSFITFLRARASGTRM